MDVVVVVEVGGRHTMEVDAYHRTARAVPVARVADECHRHPVGGGSVRTFMVSFIHHFRSFIFPLACDPFDPESSEFCTVAPEEIDGSLKRTIRLAVLFALWYVLNIGYNIGNKRVLNALPLPWTAATVELFFGFPYVAFLWLSGLRKAPNLSFDNIKTLSSQAFFLAATVSFLAILF
jgi:hypothetical protein